MADGLSLPEPIRSRVLLEMAYDLEAVYRHHRERGLADGEAVRRAEAAVLLSPEALQRLIDVHGGGLQRWLGWLSGRTRRGLDLLLFGMVVVPVLALAGVVLLPRVPEAAGSPFLWSLLGVGSGIVGLTLFKGHQYFVRRDAALAQLRSGLSSLLFLGGSGLALGALGFLCDLYLLLIRLSGGGEAGGDGLIMARQLSRSGIVLGTGILLAMGAGIFWFILANRLSEMERTERMLLLEQ